LVCPSYFYSFFFACISALLLNTVVLSPNRSLKLQILCSLYLTVCAQHLQDSFLKRIGHKHPIHSFFKILSIKCSYSIFNREMICAIFESLLSCGNELTDYVESACDLLLVVALVFPSLFQESEEYLLELFSEESVLINEKTLRILAHLAKSTHHLSINFSNVVYPLLEQKCIEGTRAESKYAITAIASLHSPNDQKFAKLCKKVVSGLNDSRNVPTLLQSLGSILEHSPSVYELYGRQIVNSIQDILMSTELISTSGQSSLDGNSTCCCSCKLKVYCLKALVKGFLPRIARARINGILGKLLEYEKGLFPDIALWFVLFYLTPFLFRKQFAIPNSLYFLITSAFRQLAKWRY